jgi:UDP-N-acetylglucosamine--N-acetylmuramyl-(pentapeptide) pyrophosphoryl-undecaprenol N-acetylglucosamine transferase
MWAMRDLVDADQRVWCTVDAPDVRSLLQGERVELGNGPTTRSIKNLVRNLRRALTIVRRCRPRVVLCTGSGIAVPFAWVGRAFGARVVYVECGGRVDRPSLSCRLIAPVAHRCYVQWPELANQVRGASYNGRLPWGGATATAPRAVRNVLITTGTSRLFPFDRLVHAADAFEDHDVTVQSGSSAVRPRGADVVDFLGFDALSAAIAASDCVVTHAGVGSVLLALSHGRMPIVMPRRPELGECVDDHQVAFAQRLADEGIAFIADGPEDVRAAVDRVRSASPASVAAGAPDLLARLRADVAMRSRSDIRATGERRTGLT